MRTSLIRTIVLTAALVALLINMSTLAQSPAAPSAGVSGLFSGQITGLTNRGSDAGAANGLSTAAGFIPAVWSLSPNRPCTAMNFAVLVDVAPGNSRSRKFSLVIGGDQSSLITCTISGPSNLTCNSGSATHLVPASSTLAIAEETGSPGLAVAGSTAAFGWECNSTTVSPPIGPPPTPVLTPATASSGSAAAEYAECKSTLQSGRISWGGGTTWASGNIDRLCNGTRNARNTIACFQSNVEALGWAAAIDKCK